jgi:Rieske Fe-S protein
MTEHATAVVEPHVTRRVVVGGALAVGAGYVLAACGGGDATDAGADGTDAPEETVTPEEEVPESEGGEGEEPAEGGAALVAVADVPVGGGVIVGASKVVVTQPSDGEIVAFSSTCTHQGCQVASVDNGEITCNCHGSRFSIEDGSVLGGPAPSPLPTVPVSVEGDQVVLTG